MTFELVEPGLFKPVEGLGEGECSLGKNGTLLLRTEDLGLVGISNYAIVLADPETFRVGLRAVRDGEQQRSVAASVVTRKGRPVAGRRRININRAIKRLGLTVEACCGRYTLSVHKDELLFITLTEAKEIPQPREPRRSR